MTSEVDWSTLGDLSREVDALVASDRLTEATFAPIYARAVAATHGHHEDLEAVTLMVQTDWIDGFIERFHARHRDRE